MDIRVEPTKHFTMKQLAQIALGGTEFTETNTIVLHTLLNILLEKMGCQNEKVTITGYEAKQLERIMQTTQTSPLTFEKENLDTIINRFDKIKNMEEDISKLEKEYDQHIKSIYRRVADNVPLPPCGDIDYEYKICEDLCSTDDEDISAACKLIQNSVLTKKIINHISTPMVKRCFQLEHKIDVFRTELCSFMNRMNKNYSKLNLIVSCFDMVDAIENQVDTCETLVQTAISEIQDILDVKTNKCHTLARTQYIEKHLSAVYTTLAEIKKQSKARSALAVVMDESKEPQQPQTASKASQTLKPHKVQGYCKCTNPSNAGMAMKPTLRKRMAAVNTGRIRCLVETTGRKSTNVDFILSANPVYLQLSG